MLLTPIQDICTCDDMGACDPPSMDGCLALVHVLLQPLVPLGARNSLCETIWSISVKVLTHILYCNTQYCSVHCCAHPCTRCWDQVDITGTARRNSDYHLLEGPRAQHHQLQHIANANCAWWTRKGRTTHTQRG